jgi:membrane dipeptidase
MEQSMLNRRTFLASSLMAGGLSVADRMLASTAKETDLLIWDDHSGFGYAGPDDINLLDKWRAAGVHYLSLNVFGFDGLPWDSAVRAIADYTKAIGARNDITLCATVSQVLAARRAGKMAVTFDIEGMRALNSDLAMVETYYRLGVRQMLIAYNLNNDAGGGCHDDDKGLTDFGRAVITEMNRVGMVVDCAHSGIKSGLEAMKLSTKPCVFSHANARALKDHERNITDEQIRAVAATGGVVGVNGLSLYLDKGPATLDALVRHINYIAKLVGVDHVGVGLDFDPSNNMPLDDPSAAKYWPERQYPRDIKRDFLSPSVFPSLPQNLRAAGYKDKDIQAIVGGNFLRVASQVWAPG